MRLPSASLLSSRLSEFLVIRGIYSASYPLQVPGKRANRKSEGLLYISGNPTNRALAARRTHGHLFPGEPFFRSGNMEVSKTRPEENADGSSRIHCGRLL